MRARIATFARQVRRSWRRFSRGNLPLIAALTGTVVLVGAGAIMTVEAAGASANVRSLGDALWYVAVTMTNTGYGDFVATTPGGRMIAVALMLSGMTLLSALTATFASILVTRRIREGRGLETIRTRGHLLICGWNQYAERVLDALLAAPGRRVEVVLVNELPEEDASAILSRYDEGRLRFVRGDPAAEAALRRANAAQASAAIVLADASHGLAAMSDERTTLVTLALKSLRADIRVTVEALDLRGEQHLRRAGADEVVISGEFNGFLLSSAALVPGISQVVRPLLSVSGSELRQEPIPPEFVDRSFGELARALRERDGFLAVAIVTERRGLTLDDLLTDDTSLVEGFIKQQFSEAGKEYLRFEEAGVSTIVNPPDSYVIGQYDAAIGIPGRT